jgi:hypothetical protein
MLKYYIPLLVAILLPGLAFCQEPELKSTKAKAAVRDYESKIEDVDEDFEKQLKDLEKSYQMKSEILRARLLSNLNAAMEEEAKRVRLEEATEIKELIKQRKETELPTLNELKWKVAKAKIPKTAVKFNGHHYAICTEQKTWHEARDYSESLGGHLARIESLDEMAFIANLGGSIIGLFLDGTDENEEGIWMFSNGEPVDETELIWLHGKGPSNGFAQHHLCFWKRTVCDTEAGGRVGFIIEWDK